MRFGARFAARLGRCFSGVLILVFLALSGCASLGEREEIYDLPEGAPSLKAVLADLAANDWAIESFRASGTFTLEVPELEGVRKFRQGSIAFQRPAALHAKARHRLTGITIFELTAQEKEYLLEFPTQPDEYFYESEGIQFATMPTRVSPAEVVREMFLPERWDELRRREARMVEFDPVAQIAEIEIGYPDNPRRRVYVVGPPWRVRENVLFDEAGEVRAWTKLDEYHVMEGVRFPTKVDAIFPQEGARMTFEMRNIRLNSELDDDRFDVKQRIAELERRLGYPLNRGGS